MTDTLWKIGTRGSRLALWQSEHVRARLGGRAELVIIKTEGDRFLEAALQTQNGKGFFTKEIEEALLDGRVDLAVHSMKDLPTELPAGLTVGAVLVRAPIADLLLVNPAAHADAAFPVVAGAAVGASSLRRQSLLHTWAPACRPALLRGNVPTRIEKLRRGEYGAIVLAEAGVTRLGLDLAGLRAYRLNPERWLPAPAQGAMAVETREEAAVLAALVSLHDAATARAVALERRLLSRFEGGCHAAFGAWAQACEAGVRLRVGHEGRDGRFVAVCVETAWDGAEEAAYAELRRALETAPITRTEGEGLCEPLACC